MRKLNIQTPAIKQAHKIIAEASKKAKKLLPLLIREELMSLKHTAAMPAVGLWWYYGGKVYPVGKPWRDSPESGGLYMIPDNHVDAWKQVKAKISQEHPSVYLSEYEEIERGRLFFNKPNNEFLLTCSKDISEDPVAISKIREAFGVPGEAKVVVELDNHYEDPADQETEEDLSEDLTEWEKDYQRQQKEEDRLERIRTRRPRK